MKRVIKKVRDYGAALAVMAAERDRESRIAARMAFRRWIFGLLIFIGLTVIIYHFTGRLISWRNVPTLAPVPTMQSGIISDSAPPYSPPSAPSGTVHVRGYTRSDGTYVHPYTRSAPHR